MTGARATAPAVAGAVSASPDALPVASYARRSKRAAGDGKGATINIADQHAQNRDYIAREFGPAVPVIEYDDNMSAWDPDKYRDDWEEMLTNIRAGQFRAVVGRYADRLTRQPEQGEHLLKACKKSGAELHTTSQGRVISALAFRMELMLAAEESDQKSRRMTDKHRTLGEAGAFSGGRRRFGYTAGMTEIVPAEAAAIQDAMARVLNGESVSSIARLWNAAGLRSAEGNEFHARTVSALLRRRDLAGLRNYGKEERPATWDAPAIVDAATSTAVIRRLSGNKPLWGDGPAPGRAHDYSGMVLCGECGRPMYGKPSKLKSGPAYFCRNPERTTPHPQAPVVNVDAGIRAQVIARLSRVDAAGVFVVETDKAAADARAAERADLDANRAETVADVRMRPGDKAGALEAIDARLAELDAEDAAEVDAVTRPRRVLAGLVGLPAEETAAAFDALPLDRRRNVVSVLGTPVLKGRNARKGVWNPRRLFLVWDEAGNVPDA